MMPKKPAPDLIRGGYRFSEKIMLQNELERDDDSKKSHPALVRVDRGASKAGTRAARSPRPTPAGGETSADYWLTVLAGHLQRSAMRHFSHSGRRATQT